MLARRLTDSSIRPGHSSGVPMQWRYYTLSILASDGGLHRGWRGGVCCFARISLTTEDERQVGPIFQFHLLDAKRAAALRPGKKGGWCLGVDRQGLNIWIGQAGI